MFKICFCFLNFVNQNFDGFVQFVVIITRGVLSGSLEVYPIGLRGINQGARELVRTSQLI